MADNTKMRAPAAYMNFTAQSGNQYSSDAKGTISAGRTGIGTPFTGIKNGDVKDLMDSGCIVVSSTSYRTPLGAVLAASLTVLVANVAASNGAKTIAAQPDVARQGVITFAPGAAAVTAGTATVVYVDQFGTTQTEVFSLVTGSGVNQTFLTKRAIARLTSLTVAAIAGGSSPTIQMGTNTTIGLEGSEGGAFGVVKETSDGVDAGGTFVVDTDDGLYTLQTAPNGTKLLVVTSTCL